MTAHELARQLLAGPDLPVVTEGYEGGLTPVRTPRPFRVGLVGPRSYMGEYESEEDLLEWTEEGQFINQERCPDGTFDTVLISRRDP